MKSVGRNLSSDVLEKIVTFLPTVSLCRFRTVSKKWNRLISHPDFASRHARASSPEEYVLITVRFDCPFNSMGSWEVLDVANKRFFTLSDDFLTKFVQQEGIAHGSQPDFWRTQRAILAADGGLFCVSYSFDHESSCTCDPGMHEALVVCNLVLRTAEQLASALCRMA